MIGRVNRKLKNAIVKPAVRLVRNFRTKMRYKGLSTQEIFSSIYQKGDWGKSADGSFYSGSGSHDPKIVAPYVDSVKQLLETFPVKPDVVDLGCGDFAVGSQLRPLCGRYIACDVVPELIEANKSKYADEAVEFRTLNIIEDDIPYADIVFLRQVLQHLSNDDILRVVPKLREGFKYLILSEHLPSGQFRHNNEKPTGHSIRLDAGGGLVLTSPPFNLVVKDERVLCEVPEFSGLHPHDLVHLAIGSEAVAAERKVRAESL